MYWMARSLWWTRMVCARISPSGVVPHTRGDEPDNGKRKIPELGGIHPVSLNRQNGGLSVG